MSTSPSRGPLPVSPSPSLRENQPEVLPFAYEEVPGGAGNQFSPLSAADDAFRSAREVGERETRLRELGRQEGESQARAHFETQLAREREAVAAAVGQFTRERSAYYQKLEGEVVKLALGIARQILHREAQVDPLLLTGIVRVALEKIEGATAVVVAIHPQNSSDWRRYLGSHIEPGDLPEIVEDPAIAPDRCEIRTSMGTAELGLEVQFKEIEQGLMDLLAARPQGNS